MTIQEATFLLLRNCRTIYSDAEASQITDWILEHITGSLKTERMLYKHEALSNREELLLLQYVDRILKHEPVQYILNEAWFFGFRFYVNSNVLIPRPETEELLSWIIADCFATNKEPAILDVGTGSGCISIGLKQKLSDANIYACDSSEMALSVAKGNAEKINSNITFRQLDFLNCDSWAQLPLFDIIVSNPPYIPQSDQSTMEKNVLAHEPHIALFVPNNKPLLFYEAIADFGKTKLKLNGSIYVEIHENFGEQTQTLFQQAGYNTELRKDMSGKNRMLKATIIH